MLKGESYKAALIDAAGGLVLAAVLWGSAIGTQMVMGLLLPLVR